MNIKLTAKSVALAAGASFAISLAASPVAMADSNPFSMSKVPANPMLMAEGKCGEGKCGGGDKKPEGKCGEGKCGGSDKSTSEGKCGGSDKKPEGKCGEGKCGGK